MGKDLIKNFLRLTVLLTIVFLSWIFLTDLPVYNNKKKTADIILSENKSTKKTSEVNLILLGDMMLDRSVYNKAINANGYDYPFQKIDNFLKTGEIVAANLEGPITTDVSETARVGGMRFTFDKGFADELSKRFNALSLANNHAMDFGIDGVFQTREFLADNKINYFGNYFNRSGETSTVIEKKGLRIGFIGYNQFSYINFSSIIDAIRSLREEVDFLVVYPHWGEEYQNEENQIQQKEAREMIDAGADLIFGSHPHVIQPIELYKNKAIFYSAGNFIFDQYFSEATMEGLAVNVHLVKDDREKSVSYRLVPLDLGKDSRPAVMDSVKSKMILNKLANYSRVDEKTKDEIREGGLTVQKF